MRPQLRQTPLILRAAYELALARIMLGQQRPANLLDASTPAPQPEQDQTADPLVAQIAWVIPGVANRVPWRADCLVQATAARRWLAKAGIGSRLHIGVRKDRAAGFEAHAWLCHGTHVVTGGDIAGFHAFERPGAGPSQLS